MVLSEDLGLSGLAALGAIGSVCAVLLRSTNLNLKNLDSMRRDAATATDKLRKELRDHDDTIFKLQGMCADYRYAIAKLEAENLLLRRALLGSGSRFESLSDENETKVSRLQDRPEDVLD